MTLAVPQVLWLSRGDASLPGADEDPDTGVTWRPHDAEGPPPTLEELTATDLVLVDGALDAPFDVIARVRRSDPSVQVAVLVRNASAREEATRARRFATGLGEIWLVEAGQLTATVARAAEVTAQRRRFRRAAASLPLAAPVPSVAKPPGHLSNVYFATLLDIIPVGVITIDGLDRIVAWNRTAARIFRRTPNEVAGTPLRQFFAADAWERVEGLLRTAGAEYGAAQPGGVHVPITRGDGTLGVVEADSVVATGGGIRMRSLVLHDVSEAVRAAAALRESEARYRLLFESMDEGFCVIEKVETRPGEAIDFSFVEANPAFAMHTGIGGVIGRSLRTAFPEEPQHWPETFDTVLRTGRPIRFEHTLVSQGRILELHSFRVGGPPRPRVAVVLSDVTARKRAEEQLRIADRLQAVGTLAGGVAHEINNQMTAVLGFGALVLKALGPSHPQASDQSLVLQAGKRAAKVSQQLLTYTRQQVTHRSVLDLQEVASDLRPVLQQLLGSDKQLVLELRDGGAKVRADRDQVEQVLINLVANARDATETGDTVSITIGDMTVAAPMPAALNDMIPIGEYVRLTVADSGAGMSAETLARSFDPFYTTKEVGRGTGLGLPMVYGTMRRHDGYVVARTALGSGTAVELYWPVTTRSDELPEPSDEAEGVDRLAIAGGGAVVLVADDEPAVCGLVVRVLEAEGYRVIGARDGASALATLEDVSARPDLVVTDIVMPALNGRQLADVLRTRWPDLPVLFMSGYTGVGDVVDRLVPSEAAYLQKPFTPGQLLHAVAQLRYGTPANRAAGQSPPIRDDIQQG